METTLYKRNAKGEPIFWNIEKTFDGRIAISHGIVGKSSHGENISTLRNVDSEIKTMINNKRKEGYKELKDLYDNSPITFIQPDALLAYLNTYLPKFNTHEDGNFIPMLCKTLQDNKPFEKHSYFGQWKINGERCIITASKSNDLFEVVKLHYRSREGVDWTDKLSYLDEYLVPKIQGELLDMMIDGGVGLDGELYLPGHNINEINSFIKNSDVPQHYQLQYWCYDLCIDDTTALRRYEILRDNFATYYPNILSREDHMNVKNRLVFLPSDLISNITEATIYRDKYIALGFEGLVIRDCNAFYQFGGKRNNSMLKYKRKEDGFFEIISIKEDKRGLPIYVLKNDINDEQFECTLNAPQDVQREHLNMRSMLIGKKGLVEYRERSGQKQVPFHAKLIEIKI